MGQDSCSGCKRETNNGGSRNDNYTPDYKEKDNPSSIESVNYTSDYKEKDIPSSIESSRAIGAEVKVNSLCSCYAEKTMNGDYNIGISCDKSLNKGKISFSNGTYAEVTYNKEDGLSVGCGVSAERSVSASIPLNINKVKADLSVYESDYTSEDKYRKNLCC